MMILKYENRRVYGNDARYPACDKSRAFLKALGLKTFTPSTVEAAKALGYTFEQVFVSVAI